MSVLDEIVTRKRADVAKRMESVPYSALREQASPTRQRFGEALRKPGLRFILECKKASPSEGLIRKNFDITEIAGAYKNFADAVSVLTDEPYFQGSPDVLREARGLLVQPILAKDFILNPYQVCEARTCGADAVLLMLSILDDAGYKSCADEARRLSMDVLTEVHSAEELDRALALEASIIGINNRNLKTLKVDLGIYSRLAGKIPPGKIVVCESGIKSHGDILATANRADAFLVGGALMKEDRLDLAVRRLIYGGVKICGLTSPEDAAHAYESGAVFGGLIFAASPRQVDEARSAEIASASPLQMVGVFVNDEIGKISRAAANLGLAAVQLHGEESGGYVESLKKELPQTCEIWKTIHVQGKPAAVIDTEAHGADRVLLDTLADGARGGTGKSFDWQILERIQDKTRVILAGGINPDNARRASEYGCFAIDVNSGVESAPGKKDPGKIKNLFGRIRGEV